MQNVGIQEVMTIRKKKNPKPTHKNSEGLPNLLLSMIHKCWSTATLSIKEQFLFRNSDPAHITINHSSFNAINTIKINATIFFLYIICNKI